MPKNRRSGPIAYREAQLAARVSENAISKQSAKEIEKALRAYAKRISSIVASLPADSSVALSQLTQTRVLVLRAAKEMHTALQTAIASGRDLAFEEIQGIWASGSVLAAEATGVPANLFGGVFNPPLSLAGAFESVNARTTWKTLLGGHATNAAKEATEVVRMGLLSGTNPEELARRLRPYVDGSQPFQQAFKGLEGFNLNKVPADLRGAARRMHHNARRIAWSETHNARLEAEVQHYAMDPLIEAVIWRLSPDRGSLVVPDECDVYAESDMFDLGPGVYPVTEVPVPPHPFDRCELVPKTRDPSIATHPKPTPGIKGLFQNVGQLCNFNG